MKTAISVPDEIFSEADRLAKRTHQSRSELYSRAIESYVKAHRHQGVREKLDAIYATENSKLDVTTIRLQRRSLPKDNW
jgi:metal-responsive CopG/Arc/MetJ family transcriptional regulator